MKKTIKLAVVAAMALGTTSAFATNGDVMIGQGAKSRSMGGVGIAKSFGAESALANPAMITSVKNMEVTVGATAFMPKVSFGSNAQANAGLAFSPTGATSAPINSADSASDFSVIPEIYFAQRINESFTYGIAVAGTAGMGTDYSGTDFGKPTDNGSFQMKTALQLLKVAIPVSYEIAGVTLGVAPVLQYGTLKIGHQQQTGYALMDPSKPHGPQNPKVPTFESYESDTGSDTGLGYEIGAAYDFKNAGVEGLTIGAVYKSKIIMEYKDTLTKSMKAFQVSSITTGDKLTQPAEIGFGISYDVMNSGNTIAFDYKNIGWGDAAGYKDFGWENQNVFALGYEYSAKTWALRAGYNYAKNPIKELDGSKGSLGANGIANYDNAAINFFNMAGFPGIVEQHFTLGGGYEFTEMFSLDGAFIYAPEVSASYDTSAMTEAFVAGGAGANGQGQAATGVLVNGAKESTADVTHSQMAVTIAATFKF